MNSRPERGMKIAALAAATLALAAGFVGAPMLLKSLAQARPQYARLFWPSLIFLWAALLPGFLALWEFWKICTQIGRDNSFSWENAHSLKKIRNLLLSMSALLLVGGVALIVLRVGHPGLTVRLFAGAAGCLLIAVLANALSLLVGRAVALKDENDLTI